MDHLMNCHGEWIWLLETTALLPILGPWVVSKVRAWFRGERSSARGHSCAGDRAA